MTPEEAKEQSTNKQVLEATETLKRNKAFTGYFLGRLKSKIDKLKQSILYNDKLTAEQMRDARVQLRTYEEIQKLVDKDEAAARKGLGIKDGDE